MTQPLALVVYEKLLPGTQLVNRLQDLNYRVQTVNDPGTLLTCALEEKPMLVLADLNHTRQNVSDAIGQLRQNPGTTHIPVIAFAPEFAGDMHNAALQAGATLAVSEAAILNHLPEYLERALRVE